MNVLAIDQGTSATKALLVGPGAEVLGRGEVPVRTRSVGADGVEADPEELFDSVLAAGRRALAAAAAPAHAVALANQGETVLAWDRSTGRPLSQAIVWQDRRSGGICARLADRAVRAVRHRGLHRRLDPRSRAGPAGRPGHGCRHPRTRGRHEAGDVGPGRVRGRQPGARGRDRGHRGAVGPARRAAHRRRTRRGRTGRRGIRRREAGRGAGRRTARRGARGSRAGAGRAAAAVDLAERDRVLGLSPAGPVRAAQPGVPRAGPARGAAGRTAAGPVTPGSAGAGSARAPWRRLAGPGQPGGRSGVHHDRFSPG